MKTFGNEEKLLFRIQSSINSGKKLALLVGSPFSAPDIQNGHGVSTVDDIVKDIENRFKQDSKFSILENDYETSNNCIKYQVAISAYLQTYGKEALHEILRKAVLNSRLDSAVFDETNLKNLKRIDADIDKWYLPKAIEFLGKLISCKMENFGTILTTNFDPLIEVSLRKNNINVVTVYLDSDGGFDNILTDNMKVIHLHGYWHGSTLHTVEQLTTKRPKLEGSLINLLSNTTLLVMAYGGWEDVFSKTLIEIINQNKNDIDVLWCFFQDDANEIENANKEFLSKLFVDVNNSLVLYKGINCHTFFQKLYDQSNNNKNKSNLLKQLYDSLNGLDFLTVIDPRYLATELNLHEHLFKIGPDFISIKDYRLLTILNKLDIESSGTNLSSVSNSICNTLISILRKTRCNIVNYTNGKQIGSIDMTFEDTLCHENKLVVDFNYLEMLDIVNGYKQVLDNDFLAGIKVAYIYYKLGYFIDSYALLSQLSKLAQDKKGYYYFLLCEFNLKALKPHLEFTSKIDSATLKQHNLTENEIFNRSPIEDNFNLLPVKEQNTLKYLKDIYALNFAMRLHVKVDSLLKGFIKEKRDVEHGGWSLNKNVKEAEYILKFLWHFINQNFLFIDEYSEIKVIFKKLTKGLLVNYSIEVGKERKNSRHYIPTYSLQSLDYWFIYIVISFIDYEELVEIFKENRINKINLDDNTKILLLNALENTSKILHHKNIGSNLHNKIIVLLLFFTYSDIDSKILTDILKNCSQHSNLIHDRKFVKAFTYFLSSKQNQITDKYQFSLLSNIVIEVLQNVENNKINKIDLSTGYFYWILTDISNFLNHNHYKITDTNSFDKVFNNITTNIYDDLNFTYTILYHIILPIYDIMPIDRQYKVIGYCTWLFNRLDKNLQQPAFNNMFIDLMFLILLKNISPNFDQFKIKYLEAIEISYNNLHNSNLPDIRNLNTKLENFGILIIINKISRQDCMNLTKELVEFNGFLFYALNIVNYNYESFDIRWLNSIDECVLDELKKDNKIKSIILNKLLVAIESDINFSINLKHLHNWIGT